MSGEIQVKKDDDGSSHKPVYIFGKDVTEIKCFRNSFICGLCGGFVGGLGTFLFTSKALLSTHMAFASIWVGVFAYWIPCRYKFENDQLVFEAVKRKQDKFLSDLDKLGNPQPVDK